MSVDLATPPKSRIFECAVSKRPGLDEFLAWLQERRAEGKIEGPWLFTTASSRYVKALLKHIDPGGRIFGMRILARQACTPASLPGFALKDLSLIPPQGADAMRRKVLVDNNPVSHVLYPGGAIYVDDWIGENPGDTELARIQRLLDSMLACPEASASGDYAGALARLTPDRGEAHRQQLVQLRERLAGEPPSDLPELRNVLRAVSMEALQLKRELLGKT